MLVWRNPKEALSVYLCSQWPTFSIVQALSSDSNPIKGDGLQFPENDYFLQSG